MYTLLYTSLVGATTIGTIFILNKIFNTHAGIDSKSPPCYPSLTTFGPKEFLKSPLEFVRKAEVEMETNIFSIWMAGVKITFIRGFNNVDELTRLTNEVASFPLGYSYFLIPTFGNHILSEHTAGSQIELLKRYLTKSYFESYLIPSQNLVKQLLQQHLPSEGVVDLSDIFRRISFSVGARNMLGDEFVPVIDKYDFDNIFGGFEMGARFIMQFVPGSSFLLDQLSKFKSPDNFEQAVLELSRERVITDPHNVFEDLIKTSGDPTGPAVGKTSVMISILKLFVFGTGYNSYNALTYLFRDILFDPELCQRLTQEQIELDQKYGDAFSLTKANEMKLLTKVLTDNMFKHTFPFLLRYVKESIQIGDVVIPKGHIVAYSPQLEHDDQSETEHKISHGFGINQHPCPAKAYVMITLRIILSELFKSYRFTVRDAKPAVNDRLVTFAPQPPLVVEYKRL